MNLSDQRHVWEICVKLPEREGRGICYRGSVGFQDSRLILMPVDSWKGLEPDALWKIPDIPCQFWLEKNCLGIRWMESDA